MTVSGAELIISDLMPSTNYDVQVAALNGAGTGFFSSNVSVLTLGTTVLYHW